MQHNLWYRLQTRYVYYMYYSLKCKHSTPSPTTYFSEWKTLNSREKMPLKFCHRYYWYYLMCVLQWEIYTEHVLCVSRRNNWHCFGNHSQVSTRNNFKAIVLKYCKICISVSQNKRFILKGPAMHIVIFCFSALPSHDPEEVDQDIDSVKDWIDKSRDELWGRKTSSSTSTNF